MSSDVLKARSALGVATRAGDAQTIIKARRNLAAANLAAFIQKTISEAPPLTEEQLNRIAVILRPTTGGGDAA